MPRKLLLLLLMLILPLQGVAAIVAPMSLYKEATNAQSTSVMPCHEQIGHHAAQTPVDENANDITHDADATNHLCCHHVFSCAPIGATHTPAHKFSDVSRFMLPLATLFIPDAPDRPPRG
ncbi:MAG: hypothetical protein ABL891_06935 [Burkholderiales bacterium]